MAIIQGRRWGATERSKVLGRDLAYVSDHGDRGVGWVGGAWVRYGSWGGLSCGLTTENVEVDGGTGEVVHGLGRVYTDLKIGVVVAWGAVFGVEDF